MTKNDKQTVKQKIEQLDELVAWFDGDDFELEQASAKLKEAAKMASEIEHDLESVQNEIREVKQSFAGEK